MELIISGVEYTPEELAKARNFHVDVIRNFNVPVVRDCMVCRLLNPIDWKLNGGEARRLNYIVIAPRWIGTSIETGIDLLPINLGCVIDDTIAEDLGLDPKKVTGGARALATDAAGISLDRVNFGHIVQPPWW